MKATLYRLQNLSSSKAGKGKWKTNETLREGYGTDYGGVSGESDERQNIEGAGVPSGQQCPEWTSKNEELLRLLVTVASAQLEDVLACK